MPDMDEQEFARLHEMYRARAKRLGGVYVEDMVLGANDGIITTFAVVAGARGGALGVVAVLILGFANLLADSFSMGASNYLARRSKSDYMHSQERMLRWEIEHEPDEKRDELTRYVEESGITGASRDEIVRGMTRNRDTWLHALMAFGPGLDDHEGNLWKHGLFTLIAFLIAGAFPLVPYVVTNSSNAFVISAITSAITLFVAGALRALVTGINWVRSGFQMLAVGSLAAAVAYGAGHVAALFVGQ